MGKWNNSEDKHLRYDSYNINCFLNRDTNEAGYRVGSPVLELVEN